MSWKRSGRREVRKVRHYFCSGNPNFFTKSLLEFSRLPSSTLVSNVIETPFLSNPLCSSARRSFRFCIPDEWFRRPKSRPVTSTSLESSESKVEQLADLEKSEEKDESTDDEGTAKQQKVVQTPRPHNEEHNPPDWRSSLSQGRLSNLFDGLLGNPPSTSFKISAPERVNVSEPKLVEHHTGSSGAGNSSGYSEESGTEEPDSMEFERMLVRSSGAVFPDIVANSMI